MQSSPPLAIVTTGLTKRYDRSLALRDIDLEIAKGSLYGLIGPNGAGKTTLIQLLAAAQEPTLGEISIFGETLCTDRSQPRLKRQIGYLPDDFPIYEDLSVWDYLDYFARLYHLQGKTRQRRLQEVLELVNLSHKRHSPTSQLSRGMKQRLGLARTIIHDPAILLLDEPVSGLDPIARQEFREVMGILHGLGTTILISSHLLSDLAELCTHLGIMEMGCLVESTTLQELYDRYSHPSVQLKVLGSAADYPDRQHTLSQHLAQIPRVQDLQWLSKPEESPTILQFQFKGNSSDLAEDLADLLRSIVEANVPVLEFRPIQANLEDIFLKIGHTQAV